MNKKGFTLVELLAVITILAIILVIAVPKISNYIVNKKKNLFLTSAKNIVRQLSYENIELETITDSKLNEVGLSGVSLSDYDLDKSLVYVVDDDVYINLKGKGQFEGMYLCGVGMSTEDTVSEVECDESEYGKLTLTVDLNGGESAQIFEEKYEKDSEIILEEPTKEGTMFKGWRVIKGDAEIEGNTLKLKHRSTTIYALWGNEIELTVELDDGTTTQVFNAKYDTGSTLQLLKPTKADYMQYTYEFDKWEVVSGNSVLSGNTLTMGSEDTTIRALYQENVLEYLYDSGSVGNSWGNKVYSYEIDTETCLNSFEIKNAMSDEDVTIYCSGGVTSSGRSIKKDVRNGTINTYGGVLKNVVYVNSPSKDFRNIKDENGNQRPVFVKFKTDFSNIYACIMYKSEERNGEPICFSYDTDIEARTGDYEKMLSVFGEESCMGGVCDTGINSSPRWRCIFSMANDNSCFYETESEVIGATLTDYCKAV